MGSGLSRRPLERRIRGSRMRAPGEISGLNPHAVVVSGMDDDFLGMTDAGGIRLSGCRRRPKK